MVSPALATKGGAAPGPLHPMVRELALDLLRDCFEDEIAHLTLRMIRDAQSPRFSALKKSHPEIYRDFMAARNGPHEALLRNRRKRVEALTALVEGRARVTEVTKTGRAVERKGNVGVARGIRSLRCLVSFRSFKFTQRAARRIRAVGSGR